MHTLDGIIQLLLQYKYIILYPIASLEGPTVSVVAGVLAWKGILSFWLSYVVLVAADLTGDTFYYSIGRWGGRRFINRWGHYVGLHAERLAAVQEHFRKHSGKTIVFGKTQAWGSLILAAAGITEMPFGRFIWLNFIATLPKSLIFLGIGYYLGHIYNVVTLKEYVDYGGLFLLVAGLIIIFFFFRKRKQI